MEQENVQEQEVKVRNVVSFDDDNIVVSQVPLLKLAKDEKVRIAIPNIGNIAMFSQHFAEGAGFIRCLGDKGEPCPACQQVDEPIKRFKINVLKYSTTTPDGTPPEDLNYVSLTHCILRIGIKQFGMLRGKHKKLAKSGGISAVDMILTCTNDAFQHWEIDDQPECLWKEDARLKKMAENIIENKFVDFENSKDRDFKFPTPLQLNKWMQAATGRKIEPKTPNSKPNAEIQADAQQLLDEVAASSEAPAGNIKGLI